MLIRNHNLNFCFGVLLYFGIKTYVFKSCYLFLNIINNYVFGIINLKCTCVSTSIVQLFQKLFSFVYDSSTCVILLQKNNVVQILLVHYEVELYQEVFGGFITFVQVHYILIQTLTQVPIYNYLNQSFYKCIYACIKNITFV